MPGDRRSDRRGGTAFAASVIAAALLAVPAAAEHPLSAIDWLSRSVEDGPARPDPAALRPAPEGRSAALTPEAISVTPLDAPTLDALGLLPAERAGLPRDLWGLTPSAELAERLAGLGPETLPAAQELILALLLAELDPPRDAEGRGSLFLARIDRLMAFGALDQGLALIEAAGPTDTPALFARWFDLALLAGDVAPACTALRARPELAPGPGALAYCLTRGGDWEAAEALVAEADMPEAERAALFRFIDPDADHEAPAAAAEPPGRPSPLLWQVLDALGESPPTAALPLAFAHADLGPSAGWKARLEAAERLTRAGVLTPNRLLGLYTERLPAASGGVWERARAVQQLEAALLAGDAARIDDILPPAWALMVEAELEVAFAALYAERILALGPTAPAKSPALSPEARALAFRAGLLTPAAAEVAAAHRPADRREGFLAAVARGTLTPETPRPPGAMAEAIVEGLTEDPAPEVAAALAEGRQGLLLLEALALLQGGGAEDPVTVARALGLMRATGQAAMAQRAALQVLLLDRRG